MLFMFVTLVLAQVALDICVLRHLWHLTKTRNELEQANVNHWGPADLS